jgi:hypothetical protein
MNIRFPYLATLAIAALFALPAAADDDDINPSIYDKYPECMNPTLAAALDPKCVMPASQIPDQIVIPYPDTADSPQAPVPR